MGKYTTVTSALKAITIDTCQIKSKQLIVKKSDGEEKDLEQQLDSITNGVTSHVGDSTHLTTEDRTLLNNLANGYIENIYTNSVNILEDGDAISTSVDVTATVTIDNIVLSADTASQNRMARAIIVMDDEETIQWLSNDGTIVTLSKSQLKQALKTTLNNEISTWTGA